jgi:hypothetical protein
MLLFFYSTCNYPIVLRLAPKVLAASHTFMMSLLESCKSADEEAQVHEMQGQSHIRVADLRSRKPTPLIARAIKTRAGIFTTTKQNKRSKTWIALGARLVDFYRSSPPIESQYPISNKPSTSHLF